MLSFASLFTRGPAEAGSAELASALAAAEAERQSLRERQQALVISRQDVLLTGTDEQLDAIEAELSGVQRSAERLDFRIPELRRLRDARRTAERTEADRIACASAIEERLAICTRIDMALGELENLFSGLEKTATVLRGIDHVRLGCAAKLNGPMRELVPEPDAVRMALVAHGPHLAQAFGVELFGGMRPGSYREHEDRVWDLVLRGKGGAAPKPPEPSPVSEEQIENAQRERAAAGRYA